MRAGWLTGLLIGCTALTARAADTRPYRVTLAPSGDARLDAALSAVSTLKSLQKLAPVSGFGLIGRARIDQKRFQTALESEGYYRGTTHITIDGIALSDPGLVRMLATKAAGAAAAVRVTTTPGPVFRLGQVRLEGTLPDTARVHFTLHAGEPARAETVLAAGQAVLSALLAEGYASATLSAPDAVEHDQAGTIDVTFVADAGPQIRIGRIGFTGLGRISPAYARDAVRLKTGQLYTPQAIEQARQALAALPVFHAVSVSPQAAMAGTDNWPVIFATVPAPRHVVAVNADYSTDLGASFGASWTDRNLFGAGQRLVFSAAMTDLGGTDAVAPGYDLEAHYIIPDWRRPDQTLSFDVLGVRQYLLTYNRTALTLDAIATRQVSKVLSLNAGVSATEETVTQIGVNTAYSFVGLPIGAAFDTTNDLLEPTKGWRARATITPTYSYGGASGSAPYVLVQGTAATYLNLWAPPGRRILALRTTLGLSEGANVLGLPPDQRFYAGGSDTIRGYNYQYAGPQFANGVPEGGTAIDTGTIELRQRFGAHYGAVLFTDIGQVNTTGLPFQGQVLAGAGLGARYYTKFGPIRLDVAVPLVKLPHAGGVQAYIGLGEAF